MISAVHLAAACSGSATNYQLIYQNLYWHTLYNTIVVVVVVVVYQCSFSNLMVTVDIAALLYNKVHAV